jgi:hypothetical protein
MATKVIEGYTNRDQLSSEASWDEAWGVLEAGHGGKSGRAPSWVITLLRALSAWVT